VESSACRGEDRSGTAIELGAGDAYALAGGFVGACGYMC
jgi:uncharacterized cupin superfamily protein